MTIDIIGRSGESARKYLPNLVIVSSRTVCDSYSGVTNNYEFARLAVIAG
jgi:hypothetical protein